MSQSALSDAAQRLLTRVSEAYPESFKTSARGRAAARELVEATLVTLDADICSLTAAGLEHLGLTPTAAPRAPRQGSKAAAVIAMLAREHGATVAQISEATVWLPHSVRGFFAGALKKKHGREVVSEVVNGLRVYRLAAK